jgi:hypothetical protein
MLTASLERFRKPSEPKTLLEFALSRLVGYFILVKFMKRFSWALAVLFLICPKLIAQTDLSPLPADGFVTLETIVGDFAQSVTSALQKYNGLKICVYGRLGKITQEGGNEGLPLSIIMQSPLGETPCVRAQFDPDFIPSSGVLIANNEMKASVYKTNWNGDVLHKDSFMIQGEKIAVRGTFDNFVAGDIVLKNSFSLGPEALIKKLAEHGIANE